MGKHKKDVINAEKQLQKLENLITKAISNKEYTKAIQHLNDYVKIGSNSSWVQSQLGKCYFKLAQIEKNEKEQLKLFENALNAYTAALPSLKNDIVKQRKAYIKRGICLFSLGNYHEAITSINHGLKIMLKEEKHFSIKPNKLIYLSQLLGNSHKRLGQFSEATKSYTTALMLCSDLVQEARKAKEFADIYKIYQALYNQRAECYMRMEAFPQALADQLNLMKKAYISKPSKGEAYFWFAKFYKNLNEPYLAGLAEIYLKKASAADTQNKNIYSKNFAELLPQPKKFQFRSIQREVINLKKLCKCENAECNALDSAIPTSVVMEVNSDNEVYIAKAKKGYKHGNYQEAIDNALKALPTVESVQKISKDTSDEIISLMRLLGHSYAKLKEYGAALFYYTQALKFSPSDISLHQCRLQIYKQLYKKEKSEKSKTIIKKQIDQCNDLIKILQKLEKTKKSKEQEQTQATPIQPDKHKLPPIENITLEAFKNASDYLSHKGKYLELMNYATKVLKESDKEEVKTYAQLQRGIMHKILFLEKIPNIQHPEAVHHAQNGINDLSIAIEKLSFPSNAEEKLEAYFHRGEIYRLTGKYEEAIQDYRCYIENALKIDSFDQHRFAMVYISLGLALFVTQNYLEAIKYANGAMAMHPDNPKGTCVGCTSGIHGLHINVYTHLGADCQGLIAAYKKLQLMESNRKSFSDLEHIAIINTIASIYNKHGFTELAFTMSSHLKWADPLSLVEKIDPKKQFHPSPLIVIENKLPKLPKPGKYKDDLRTATYFNLYSSFTEKEYENVGRFAYDHDNYQTAIDHFSQALSHLVAGKQQQITSPEDTKYAAKILNHIANCFYSSGRYEAAIFYYNFAFSIDPSLTKDYNKFLVKAYDKLINATEIPELKIKLQEIAEKYKNEKTFVANNEQLVEQITTVFSHTL